MRALLGRFVRPKTLPAVISGAMPAALAPLFLVAGAPAADAHPHVFVNARVEIVGDKSGRFTAVRNIWRMDPMFSSSVVVDFDVDASGALEADELDAVGETVRQSIAEWNFYTVVKSGGEPVAMQAPDRLHTDWRDGQLLFFFEMPVVEPVDLTQTPVTITNFDDSYFVAFDFDEHNGFQLTGLPDGCERSFDEPDPDEAAQRWMETIASYGPDDQIPEDGIRFSDALSTRTEVSCAGIG